MSENSMVVSKELNKKMGRKYTRRKLKNDGTSSGFYGVGWHTALKKWQTRIRIFDGMGEDGKPKTKIKTLGTFYVEENAALTYDFFSRKYFGKDAVLNFPKKMLTEKEFIALKKKERQEFKVSKSKDVITSRYTGVSWSKHAKKWVSRLLNKGDLHYLGTYFEEEDAAKAYDKQAKLLGLPKSKINFA